MSQPERQVYHEVAIAALEELAKKLKSRKDFTDKKHLPDSENCHFIRYSYLYNKEKVSIVFDTKAEMLTVTAFKEAIDIIGSIFTVIKAKYDKKRQKVIKKTMAVSASDTEVSSDDRLRKNKNRKSMTVGVAKKLNTYASDERASEGTVEKYYVAYDYIDMQKARVDETRKSGLQLASRPSPKLLESSKANAQTLIPAGLSTNQNPQKLVEESKSTLKPNTNTKKSPANAPKPNANAPKPNANAPKPNANAPKPNANAPKPNANAPKPSANAPKPNANAPKPNANAPKPNANAPKPNANAPKPNANAPKPNANAPNVQNANVKQGTNTLTPNTNTKNQANVPKPNSSVPKQTANAQKQNVNIQNLSVAPVQNIEVPEYKDGYIIKGMSQDKVKAIILKLDNAKDLKIFDVSTVKSAAGNIVTYSIEDSLKQKVYIRHIIRNNMLQIQGKKSKLFTDMQILLLSDSKVSTPNKADAKQQKNAYKEVKKALPYGFDYLTEQSKIDFSIGLIDIYSESVRLSDYSVLLVPPYRGLERLLFDLQKAKDIEVKMIGQAYEKSDGKYTLKLGYQKKIDSIVYNEALSALYTEYFEKRNFYAHSNNTDEISQRVITDRSQAKSIFEALLKLINYNCKKLKEIGFTTK